MEAGSNLTTKRSNKQLRIDKLGGEILVDEIGKQAGFAAIEPDNDVSESIDKELNPSMPNMDSIKIMKKKSEEVIDKQYSKSQRVKFNVKEALGFESELMIEKLVGEHKFIPKIDEDYTFDKEVTEAVLVGFQNSKNVMLYGFHGTGKSSHIEQIAARLNWPCVRINLDGNISRYDLIGKDAISLKEGKQISEFQDGMLTQAVRKGYALILDEYDAGRPEVMFVIQRLLEQDGKLTLLDNNEVVERHPDFRIFATANTIGLGDDSGIYHGTSYINQSQLDRWHIVVELDYMDFAAERKVLLKRFPYYAKSRKHTAELEQFIHFANLTRKAFMAGELSTVVSLRTLIFWCENRMIFNSVGKALKYAFLSRCDKSERHLLNEMYQRVFGEDLGLSEQITN